MNTTEHQDEMAGPLALDTIAAAEINQQIATAKRFPRTLSKVKSDMLSFATLDEETASACFYTLPRGGKAIQGPSVRLAEIAVACYGNLRAGSRITQTVTDGPNPHVVVQSVAHDLEKNTAITIEKRRRITKKKHKETIDEDDINLACNACSAIAFRDAVFKVVPQALIRPVYEAAKKVAVGEASSLVAKRGKIFDRLKQMGVTEDRILAVLELKKIDDVALEHLEILIGLGTAIKDGDTTIEEAFPAAGSVPRAEATPGPGTTAPAKEAFRRTEKPKEPAKTETTPPPGENKTGEDNVDMSPPPGKIIDVTSKINTGEPVNLAEEAAKQENPSLPATSADSTTSGTTASGSTASGGATSAPAAKAIEVPPSKMAADWLPFLDANAPADVLKSMQEWMTTEGITEAELLALAVERKWAKPGQKLNELATAKLTGILKQREPIRVSIFKARG